MTDRSGSSTPVTEQIANAVNWWTEKIVDHPSSRTVHERLTDFAAEVESIIRKSAGQVASVWQPIETAPKDGTPVLIFQPDYEEALDRRSYGGKFETWGDMPYDDHCYAIGYWRPLGGWGNRNSAKVNPSHWMPLPALPAPRPASREGLP